MAEHNFLSNLRAITPKAATEMDAADAVRFEYEWINAAAIAGTTALAETAFGRVKRKCRLVGLDLHPSAAVTANASDYFTIVVRKRTAALPGTQVAIASFATDTVTTDDLVAFARKDLMAFLNNVASADLDFADGDAMTVQITKTGGSGLAFPIAKLTAEFEPRD